jgi:hypothetical protein
LVVAWYAIDPLVAFTVGVNVPHGVRLPTLTVSPALPTPSRACPHEVEQHQVVVAAAGHLEPAAAVGGAVDLDAGQGQGPGHHLADSRFVLDHKEPLHRITPLSSTATRRVPPGRYE